MEVIVNLEPDQHDYDTGGGYRKPEATITIDSELPYWRQVQTLVYEGLGLLYGNVIAHDQLTDASDFLTDLLQQLEAKRGQESP